jgi:hypothetical protein
MTLAQVISTIEAVASQQPHVNTIVRHDVFRINSLPSLKYGVFAWLQNQHNGRVASGMMTYSFTFFYVDLLTEDGGNRVDVQSAGCEVMRNLLASLDAMDIAVDSYTIQPFNQRFTDECAGVFCNVSVSVLAEGMCAEAHPNKEVLTY